MTIPRIQSRPTPGVRVCSARAMRSITDRRPDPGSGNQKSRSGSSWNADPGTVSRWERKRAHQFVGLTGRGCGWGSPFESPRSLILAPSALADPLTWSYQQLFRATVTPSRTLREIIDQAALSPENSSSAGLARITHFVMQSVQKPRCSVRLQPILSPAPMGKCSDLHSLPI